MGGRLRSVFLTEELKRRGRDNSFSVAYGRMFRGRAGRQCRECAIRRIYPEVANQCIELNPLVEL